ncbi:triple tyrosine motif-containing protein [Seonamhaeicola sp. ML3]|uniref:triple tyrosine motif-containing protein n=1 Tax=Seonamhaeicola sp. ML3 TaxID=2937786 RepID=UPI0020103266|nr:triple tyrosine motif-containing protein [Seonamhaeicola sp. ML3]
MRHSIFTIYALVSFFSIAQELPPIQSYSPEIYGADNQNWCIDQTSDKHIYVANNVGLLEFNGEKWTLYNSPSGKMRSLKVIDDLIYSGAYQEFGFWKKTDNGKLTYYSLSKELDINFLEDEEFWNIINIDNYILFQSLKRIYIYNSENKTHTKLDSENRIYKMFKIDKTVYFQKVKQGLYKIEQGKQQLVSDHDIIKNNYLVNIFKEGKNTLLLTEENGIYQLTPDQNLTKWDIPANKDLSMLSSYRGEKTSKGYLIGTRSNGIYHINKQGAVDYSINSSKGLLSNSIHDIFEDAENNIWLALENGINCINLESPFQFFHDQAGKIGTTYASAIQGNYLYLGTNQGLFYKKTDSNEFKFVEGTEGPVWSLRNLKGSLFCGHNLGTFIIENGKIKKRIDVDGTWNIVELPNKQNLLLQGNYNGLSIIERIGDTWELKNKIKGFNISSKFLEVYNGYIFVNHEYKGVFKLKTDKDFKEIIEINQDLSVKKGIYSSLVKYNNKILYTNKDGVYQFYKKQNSFVKDSLFSQIFKKQEFTSGKLIADQENNILWGFSKNKLNYITSSGLSAKPKLNSISFSEKLPRGLTGSENISHLFNKSFLIGTSDGYTILDLDKVKETAHTISIDEVKITDQENKVSLEHNKNEIGNFKNKLNNLEFHYSVPEFNKYQETYYQYKLEGFYKNWSSWSLNPKASFKNLPYGSYQFKVRAKNGSTLTENIGVFKFSIARPWYLSNLSIALYVLALLLISIIIHNIYKRYYRKQRERIILRSEREIELKELENKQQLMRFRNEKLRQDIEGKNRELGISTMSLIKKNDFLNSIKLELLNIENNDKVKRIVKIIDQNLNNRDDWKVFEEAFNNADKDFLKKVKQIHPELTPNDLRLCAYLRLNLSSKEIAPLLNISPRSVEVKRYRLRKKMNLPHEESLTNYILEI